MIRSLRVGGYLYYTVRDTDSGHSKVGLGAIRTDGEQWMNALQTDGGDHGDFELPSIPILSHRYYS